MKNAFIVRTPLPLPPPFLHKGEGEFDFFKFDGGGKAKWVGVVYKWGGGGVALLTFF